MPALDSEAFLKHLRATFRGEADEHLRAMAALLEESEQPVPDSRWPQIVEALFREAHSLKGAARSVNLFDIEAICAEMEDLLAPLKRYGTRPDAAQVATLVENVDDLRSLLAAEAGEAESTQPPRPPQHKPAPGEALPEKNPTSPERGSETAGIIRIPAKRLSALLVQAEELLAFKGSAGRLADELRGIGAELVEWRKAWSRTAADARALRRANGSPGSGAGATDAARGRSGGQAVDRLLDAVERDDIFVKALSDRLARLQHLAEQEQRALGSIADALQDDLKQALMQPFGVLLEVLPKLVRELARDQGKQIELQIDGAGFEIDRRILEQMKDPVIHLVRNAVDHGIEPPAQRKQRGKPEKGRIAIGVTPKEGNQVELLISDDGGGIDPDRVLAAALKLGLVPAADAGAMSRSDVLALVYASGLSTSPILTDISGRGLGLAIVREKIEKLGGSITIETPEGGGTRFRALLPTTLANFHGVQVAVGEREFVLPARNVQRVMHIAPSAIRTIETREAIEFEGRALPLVWLSAVLGLPAASSPSQEADSIQVVVLATAGNQIAFAVDGVIGDQQVLVKGLGPQLKRVRHIAGATVLGAGRLVPILSVPDLMQSALRGHPRPVGAPAARPQSAERRAILVVEDSITARSLLKNILESAGYEVRTAVDGIDALTVLRTARFDLVVSDVEMPRMDGFDLTARIRRDPKLAGLPVILVTALESREHRERGVDVGADAYIVKSSFDQSNLLEMIRRLT